MDAPPQISGTHSAGKQFPWSLSREVLGQQQVPINTPNRWSCSKQMVLVLHKYSAGEVLQEMAYLLLGYLHILRWKPHSYLSSVTAVLGIPHFPMWLLAAPHSQQLAAVICSLI